MELLLLKYGYLLLFFGVIVEGEVVLIAGSFLASRGYFNVGTVALVALAANTLSAQFYYTAARVRGRGWFEGRFPEKSAYRQIINWVGTRDNWLLLISRFLFGFRIVIPAACGAFGMPAARFTVINIFAGLLWVVPTTLAGYYFGEKATVFIRGARHYSMTAGLAGALAAVGIFLAWRHIRRFRAIFQNLEWSDLHNALPFVMGLMGGLNILAALLPSSESLLRGVRGWLPLEVSQGSRTLMLFTGVALLQVTRNLARRKELAWWVAVIALSFSLLLHVTSGFDVQNSLVALILLVYSDLFPPPFLHPFGSSVAAERVADHATSSSDGVLLRRHRVCRGAVPVQVVGALVARNGGCSRRNSHRQIGCCAPDTQRTAVFELAAVRRLDGATLHPRLILRPFISRDRLEAPKEDLTRIFAQFGNEAVSAFAIQSDKHHLVVANGQGLAAFATRGSIALACGDPIASDELFLRPFRTTSIIAGGTAGRPCVLCGGCAAAGLSSTEVAIVRCL